MSDTSTTPGMVGPPTPEDDLRARLLEQGNTPNDVEQTIEILRNQPDGIQNTLQQIIQSPVIEHEDLPDPVRIEKTRQDMQ